MERVVDRFHSLDEDLASVGRYSRLQVATVHHDYSHRLDLVVVENHLLELHNREALAHIHLLLV